jgi:alpha-D-ribose 1-methylphosphonate 5-triphosphate diphosphatase
MVMKRIINGTVVGPDTLYPDHQVLIQGDKILYIIPGDGPLPSPFLQNSVEVIDAEGGIIAPGLIDIHSDYIEHMVAPRPTSLMDFTVAVRELERELLSHGVTTTFHSLSFFHSSVFPDKAIRRPENTRKFVELIDAARKNKHLIHHRFHARFEIDCINRTEELERYIREKKVHLLSFMDHSPGQGQYGDLQEFRRAVKGFRGIMDEEIDVMIEESKTKQKMTIAAISQLSRLAKENGIAVASHDDDSPEKLELGRELGMEISEFPVNLATALRAREMDFHTVAGAPNVLLGGSHTGNLSAAEAVQKGAVDILCSDYYPASLIHAVFLLHEQFGQSLVDAFRLVTINPARAVKIDGMRGSLEPGKEADILIIKRLDDGFPAVNRAFVSGVESMTMQYRSTA